MKIKLGGNYQIINDGICLMLQKLGTISDPESVNFGKETANTEGYYPTIETACDGYIRKVIVNSDATTLQQLADEIANIKSEIRKSLGREL